MAAQHRPNFCALVLSHRIAEANLEPQVTIALLEDITKIAVSLNTCDRLVNTPVPLAYTRWVRVGFRLRIYALKLCWQMPIFCLTAAAHGHIATGAVATAAAIYVGGAVGLQHTHTDPLHVSCFFLLLPISSLVQPYPRATRSR